MDMFGSAKRLGVPMGHPDPRDRLCPRRRDTGAAAVPTASTRSATPLATAR